MAGLEENQEQRDLGGPGRRRSRASSGKMKPENFTMHCAWGGLRGDDCKGSRETAW